MKCGLEDITNRLNKSYVAVKGVVSFPYRLYKNNRYVNMNVNVLAAASPSITIASLASEYFKMSGFSNLENSVVTAATDWAVYIPVHVGLQYFSNREKFRDEKDHMNLTAFTKDMLRIYKTYIPSILLFYVIAGPAHNLCLHLGMDGDSATTASYWSTMLITRALHTYNLYKSDNKEKNLGGNQDGRK